jgi:hypothetical protein
VVSLYGTLAIVPIWIVREWFPSHHLPFNFSSPSSTRNVIAAAMRPRTGTEQT